MRDELTNSIHLTHEVLSSRLDMAQGSAPSRDRPRDRFPATDRFLASTSRHVAAANAVLLPAVCRDVAGGRERAHDFTRQSRRLEDAMFQAKSKLYGSTYAIRRPWREVWGAVRRELDVLLDLEEELVDALPDGDDRDRLAERLYECELRSPTRPHPHLPHRGFAGRVARRVAVRVDGFWDTAEGRMIPDPVRPTPVREGPMTQYLLANPNVE